MAIACLSGGSWKRGIQALSFAVAPLRPARGADILPSGTVFRGNLQGNRHVVDVVRAGTPTLSEYLAYAAGCQSAVSDQQRSIDT